jgi:hypothetical protein
VRVTRDAAPVPAPAPEGTEAAPEAHAARGRWKRWLLYAALGCLALLAVAPYLLGPLLRGTLEKQLTERLGATVRVQRLSLAWPARLRVSGVAVTGPGGVRLASLDELHASLGLAAFLSGRIEAEVELAYPEVHVARRPDGHWDLAPVLETIARGRASPDEDEPEAPLPEVQARVRVRDGHLVVHGPGGETTLSDVALELDVESLERPAPFRLSLNARGPAGAGGGLRLEGSLTVAPEGRIEQGRIEQGRIEQGRIEPGRIEPGRMAGELALTLADLDLAAFAPALGLLGSVEGLGGILAGKLELALGQGLTLTGKSDVELRALSLKGPRAEAPARIESIALRGEATQQGEGAGTQRLELTAGAMLTLRYEGRSDLAPSGPGALSGVLTLAAELGPLGELARGWLPLQAGVDVQGRLEHHLELDATLADREPAQATLRARGGVSGLAARDASGRALDLGELAGLSFELESRADWTAGTLSVARLGLEAGPVTCTGALEATGLRADGSLADFALRTGALRLEADLERLRGTLAQLVELAPDAFGGRVKANLTLGAEADGLALNAALEARELAFAGTSLATLDGELSARRVRADSTLTGAGELRLGQLTLSLADGKSLDLPGARLTLALQEDTAGKGKHSLELESTDGAFGLTLGVVSERRAELLRLASTLRFDGRLARLAELGAAFAPLQPGLAGELSAEGEMSVALEKNTLTGAGGKLALTLAGLSVRDAAGTTHRLEALAETTLALEGFFDARAGTAVLARLALLAGGLEVSGSGRATGLAAGAVPALEAGHLTLEADLARLGAELTRVVDLRGWSVGGSPLKAEIDFSAVARRIQARGLLSAAELSLARPEGAPLAVADLGLDFELGYDHALGSLHVKKAALSSRTGTLTLAGTLNELFDPTRARGAMKLELGGELERLLADLGLETPESGRRTQGALTGTFAVEGDRGAFRVTGKAGIERFRLELAPAAEGQAPLVVEEPSLLLELAAGVTLPAVDVDLEKLTLTSTLARGGAKGRIRNLQGLGSEELIFEGLAGDLVYVPDRLGPVLAPFLPGKLSGAAEERVTFTLDGRARELDLWSILTGSSAHADLGIGLFERPEIQLGGALSLETQPGKVLVRGDLAANGGTLKLDGTLDLAQGDAQPRSHLSVTARELRANSGLAPLLALVHPAFATAPLAKGSVDGLIGLDLDLSYDAPLTLEQLEAGWETLPKTPINGSGRLELRSASLEGSPLMAMLAEFGVDAEKALDLRPIEFTVQKGRVSYAKPWSWTLAGTETTFSGSLGLDQSLDLAWNLPVTAALVERWSFLASLQGESLSIPLRGTVTKPRLEADSLLKDLAAKAAKKELESRLGLGGGKSGDDPQALLDQADELWKQNKKAEAAALYLRLREEFKLSLPYALNKDRIKDRSKYKDPPK